MNFTVKNTTLRVILDLIYPCYCWGCGKIGERFCFRCNKYNKALNPPFSRPLEPDFHKLFVCGLKEGMLAELISEYKFHSRRYFAPVLADMIYESVKTLPPETLIVPLPTIRKHIRKRGFDHIFEISLELSKNSGFKVAPLLSRARETIQVGQNGKVRRLQAREAFALDKKIFCNIFSENPSSRDLLSRPILIIDDVWTTGASMKSASFILRSAGLQNIYGVVIAKNNGYEFT